MAEFSPKTLLKMHMDCLFTYQNDRMAYVNEPWGSTAPAPLLMVGHTTGGDILYRFGRQADTALIKRAESLLSCGIWEISAFQKEIGILSGSQERCFYSRAAAAVRTDCRLLTGEDAELLETTFKGYGEELACAQPYVGYFCDGRIVSICRSVRKGRGHEAGIETLPGYRRRGCAQAVLECWTALVRQQGFVPLYSADIANTASLQLAQKSRYALYASAFSLG